MSPLMQTLFQYLSEKYILDFLPEPYIHHCGELLEAQETALLNTLDDAQKALWKQWQTTQMDYDLLYEQALFQAAFSLVRELS